MLSHGALHLRMCWTAQVRASRLLHGQVCSDVLAWKQLHRTFELLLCMSMADALAAVAGSMNRWSSCMCD